MKGWRKWSVAVLALGGGFVLSLIGKMSGEFAAIATATVACFTAGNAAVHWKRNEEG